MFERWNELEIAYIYRVAFLRFPDAVTDFQKQQLIQVSRFDELNAVVVYLGFACFRVERKQSIESAVVFGITPASSGEA